MNHATTSEILLALRAPDAGWLSVLASVIDEASHDAQFDARQRQLAMQLLANGSVPPLLAAAAHQRATRFEAELEDRFDLIDTAATSRPKLTLAGQ